MQAFKISAIEYLLATGIMRFLSSSAVACSETVRLSGIFSFASRYISGTTPQVESEILRAETFSPFSLVSSRRNFTTLS